MNSTRSGIAGYSDQIAAAQQQADALAEQISQQEEDIEALKKQLEEELAKSRLARQSSWRDISEVTFTEDDRYLLANLIYCEAGNQPYEGQVAVGAVAVSYTHLVLRGGGHRVQRGGKYHPQYLPPGSQRDVRYGRRDHPDHDPL